LTVSIKKNNEVKLLIAEPTRNKYWNKTCNWWYLVAQKHNIITKAML